MGRFFFLVISIASLLIVASAYSLEDGKSKRIGKEMAFQFFHSSFYALLVLNDFV